jgi:hypothetical protein
VRLAIGVAIVIEVQGTNILQISLSAVSDSILVDPVINIIPLEVPYQLWTFHIGSGAAGSLGLLGEHTTELHLVKLARTTVGGPILFALIS